MFDIFNVLCDNQKMTVKTDLITILKYPDARLRQKSSATYISPSDQYVENFIQTMIQANGIGLASIQVGDTTPYVVVLTDNGPIFALEPKILKAGKTLQVIEEGCLSIPGIYGLVRRPNEVTVEFTDLQGKKQREKFYDIEATCWQHEIDHLSGILFIDKAHKITTGDIDLAQAKIF